MAIEVKDLHNDAAVRESLLHVKNLSARETSLLTREKLDRMISSARVATFIEPSAAFLLAFEQNDDYDGGHFLWFRNRLEKFLYIDRVVVAEHHRRGWNDLGAIGKSQRRCTSVYRRRFDLLESLSRVERFRCGVVWLRVYLTDDTRVAKALCPPEKIRIQQSSEAKSLDKAPRLIYPPDSSMAQS